MSCRTRGSSSSGTAPPSRASGSQRTSITPFPAWDVYYLFGPDAAWTDVPGQIVSSGATIIGQSSALEDAITPLLAT
jgi:hypothetical protein